MTALGLIVAVALLVLNGVFVAAEFAAVSVRRAQIEQLAESRRGARRVLRAQRRLSMLLAGAQFGITLCSLGLGAVAEPSLARLLEHGLHAAHLPAGAAHPVGFVIALLVVVLLHMVLGEMVPKNVALARPESTALALVPALDGFVGATRPLIGVFNASANSVLRLAGIDPKDELKTAYTPEELADVLSESRAEGLLAATEHQRIARTLALSARTAADVVIAAQRLAGVAPTAGVAEIQALVARTSHVRIPVLDGGALLGYVLAQDTLDVPDATARELLRPLPEIDAAESLPDVLMTLRSARTQMARVSDASGTLGVLTLDDVLRQLIGTD